MLTPKFVSRGVVSPKFVSRGVVSRGGESAWN